MALAVGIVVGLALLVASGVTYQRISAARDRASNPPPGDLIDVDGRPMHLLCMGEGTPTVVLLSGISRTSMDWSLVQPAVAQFVRACAYDDAGYFWSEPSPKPRTAWYLAEELHALLHNGGAGGPYVLVGHSFGGIVARVFAGRYPDEAAGLVQVDCTHPDFAERAPEIARMWKPFKRKIVLARELAPLGVTRALAKVVLDAVQETERLAVLPPPSARAVRAAMFGNSYWPTVAAEQRHLAESLEQARRAGRLGDKPHVVIAASPRRTFEGWPALQEDLLDLAPNSRLIVAQDSDHYVTHWEPHLVVEAIRDVVEQVRRTAGDRVRQPEASTEEAAV